MIIYKKLKALLIIIRPINCLISSISVLIAYIIGIKDNGVLNINNLLLAVIAAGLTCAAGNVINDYYDLETDKINKPQRVLPKSYLTQKEALLFYAVIVLVSLDIAFLIGLVPFLIVLCSNIILFFYSFYLKRLVLAGNITVASMTGLAFLFGAIVAENPEVGIIPAFFALIANLIREIVKDMEDIKGDEKAGIVTFPIKYGCNNTVYLILILAFVLILFTFIPMIFMIYKIEYFVVIALLVNPIIVISVKEFIITIFYDRNIDKSHKRANGFSLSDKQLKNSSRLLKLSMVLGLLAIYAGV